MPLFNRMRWDAVRDQRRDKTVVDILVSLEDVFIHAFERVHRVVVGEDVDGGSHHRVESPHFIKPENVIHMIVREENTIASLQVRTQRLLSKIRTRIQQNDSFLPGRIDESDRRARSKTSVSRV